MKTRQLRLVSVVLTIIFVLALLMGAGPGLYLINPDASDPEATRDFLGMPVIYVWALFWFLVEAAVVVVAYITVWDVRREEP